MATRTQHVFYIYVSIYIQVTYWGAATCARPTRTEPNWNQQREAGGGGVVGTAAEEMHIHELALL